MEYKCVPSRKVEQDYKIVLWVGKEGLEEGRKEGGLRKLRAGAEEMGQKAGT